MKIIKTNEQYALNKVLENGWEVEGNVTKYESGTLSFWVSVTSDKCDIGNISYSNHPNNHVDANYDIFNSNTTEFTNIMNQIIDEVLAYFNN